MDSVNIFKGELRNKVRVAVPFIEGAWVEFYDDTTVDAVQKAQTAQLSKDIIDNLSVIINQIAAWNFADEKGELPITTHSLARFPMKLIKWLADEQGKMLQAINTQEEEQKKN